MSLGKVNIWFVLLILLLLFYIFPGFNHGLWRPDEPRVAGTCAEMARTGDYVVPHLNGKPFLEKPPLYYAIAAYTGSILGLNVDISYRIVSLFFALLSIFFTFLIASQKNGPIPGIIAAGICASSWEFFMLARWVQVDIILVFGVVLAMFSYLRWIDKPKAIYSILLGISTGTAFMAKGLIGPAIICVAILADIIRRKDISAIWRIRPFTIIVFMLIPILPWIIGLWLRGGWPFMRVVLVVNNLMRFTGAPEGAALGHQNGILYYLMHFPGNFLPWTIIFVPALIWSIKNFKNDPYICWFLAPFMLLSLASTKRGLYLVPLYPAAACMIACWLQTANKMKWEDLLVRITWGFAIAGCFTPLAGIYFGLPLLGISMSLICVISLILIYKGPMLHLKGLSLTALACVAVCANGAVYFEHLKPNKDYLGYAKEAITKAGTAEIKILYPDETLEGIIPMVLDKTVVTVSSPINIKGKGVYVWSDRKDARLKTFKELYRVEMLFQKDLGDKTISLAMITPPEKK